MLQLSLLARFLSMTDLFLSKQDFYRKAIVKGAQKGLKTGSKPVFLPSVTMYWDTGDLSHPLCSNKEGIRHTLNT